METNTKDIKGVSLKEYRTKLNRKFPENDKTNVEQHTRAVIEEY